MHCAPMDTKMELRSRRRNIIRQLALPAPPAPADSAISHKSEIERPINPVGDLRAKRRPRRPKEGPRKGDTREASKCNSLTAPQPEEQLKTNPHAQGKYQVHPNYSDPVFLNQRRSSHPPMNSTSNPTAELYHQRRATAPSIQPSQRSNHLKSTRRVVDESARRRSQGSEREEIMIEEEDYRDLSEEQLEVAVELQVGEYVAAGFNHGWLRLTNGLAHNKQRAEMTFSLANIMLERATVTRLNLANNGAFFAGGGWPKAGGPYSFCSMIKELILSHSGTESLDALAAVHALPELKVLRASHNPKLKTITLAFLQELHRRRIQLDVTKCPNLTSPVLEVCGDPQNLDLEAAIAWYAEKQQLRTQRRQCRTQKLTRSKTAHVQSRSKDQDPWAVQSFEQHEVNSKLTRSRSKSAESRSIDKDMWAEFEDDEWEVNSKTGILEPIYRQLRLTENSAPSA